MWVGIYEIKPTKRCLKAFRLTFQGFVQHCPLSDRAMTSCSLDSTWLATFILERVSYCRYLHAGTNSPGYYQCPFKDWTVIISSHWLWAPFRHVFTLVSARASCNRMLSNRLPSSFCLCQCNYLSFPKRKSAKTTLKCCPINFLDDCMSTPHE